MDIKDKKTALSGGFEFLSRCSDSVSGFVALPPEALALAPHSFMRSGEGWSCLISNSRTDIVEIGREIEEVKRI